MDHIRTINVLLFIVAVIALGVALDLLQPVLTLFLVALMRKRLRLIGSVLRSRSDVAPKVAASAVLVGSSLAMAPTEPGGFRMLRSYGRWRESDQDEQHPEHDPPQDTDVGCRNDRDASAREPRSEGVLKPRRRPSRW
jgi:hypothetical protein